jgi:hypothetical protein
MHRSAIAVVIFCLLSIFSQAQAYWQQEVNYSMQVTLNDRQHSLNGKTTIEYINHSPDTISFIWFHIWPNAYRNDQTALAKQLKNEKANKKNSKNKEAGWIDSLNFTIDGNTVTSEAHPEHIDIIKVNLPKPLMPEQRTIIKTPFYVQLPSYYSRSGHVGQQYMICQWYPKPAVYDKKGWHAIPYLDQGEFYSEFGSFKVDITVPSEYVIGATGTLQNKEEYEKYKSIGSVNYVNREKGPVQSYTTEKRGQLKTISYTAENVHDFAWFADKDFVIQYDTLQLPSGKIMETFTFYQPNGNKEWRNSISFVEDAITHYSNWIGEYPYPVVQAVEGPKNESSGGMEYPMITLITSPGASKESLDGVITHEVGHNWFYGILGTNERDQPWMDEGLNTYYEFRYEAIKYRSNGAFGEYLPKNFRELSLSDFQERIYSVLNSIPAQKPIFSSSTDFSNKEEYGDVVYLKTAVWCFIIENSIGQDNLDKGMQEYFEKWKFKHPSPEDLQEALEKSSGRDLNRLFDLLYKVGRFN